MREKLMFQELVMNFINFWQNNSIKVKKKISLLKILATRKVHIFIANHEFCQFSTE